jgi:hypothetical protein
MNNNVDKSPLRYHWHDRLSIQGNATLLTVKEIERLQDGEIIYIQWPNEEGAAPYRIRTRDYEGYDRPWIYATDFNHYIETRCFWHREISGYGLHKDLKVWRREEPDPPEHEDGIETFITIEWQ